MLRNAVTRLLFRLVLLTVALASSRASAQPSIDPNAYYVIRNAGSSKVMDVSNNGCCNGAWIHLWTYEGLPNQEWRIVSVGGGYYKIEARSSGRVLDVQSASTSNAAKVHQWEYEGLANQEWAIVPSGPWVIFVARHSGKLAVAAGSVSSNGTLIRQYGPGSWPDANYKWRLEEVP